MPSTIVKASELLAAIADRPAPGDVLEVEPGTVSLGAGTRTWSGDFEVRPKTMPPDVLGPACHRGGGFGVTLQGSLALRGGVAVRGFNLDARPLGDYGPGALLLSGACDVEDMRVSSWGIAVTTGQFTDRARGVRIKRLRLEQVGRPGDRAKYHQALYMKAVDRGGLDVEDVLAYDCEAYVLQFYPNSIGARVRRVYSWDTAWGVIYSGELGNTSTGGSGSSHENEVYASIVGGLRGNASGSRRAIESWWGAGAPVGVGNLFAQGSYVGGASGSGYTIRESIQVAPKRLNPAVPGDYRQAPDSPTAHLGPLSLRPGGVTPAPPPSEEPPVVVPPPPAPDMAGPVMAWVQPAAGAVLKGSFLYTATAADPSGIEWVEFSLRDSSRGIDKLLFRELSAPYGETPFDTSLLPDGPYSLIAVGRDRAGNETTITRPVVIANAPPAPPPDPEPDPDPPDGDLAAQLAAALAALATERAAHEITAGERNALIDQVTRIRAGVAAETQRHLGAIADILED